MSDDGTILAAVAWNGAGSWPTGLSLFSLPSGAMVNSWSYPTVDGRNLDGFSLAGSGQILGEVLYSNNLYFRQTQTASGTLSALDTHWFYAPVVLSPDGTRAALTITASSLTPTTNLFLNGNLVTALPGQAVAWLDNDRLLLQVYKSDGTMHNLPVPDGAVIYNTGGVLLARLSLPALSDCKAIDANLIYSSDYNSIFSIVTGKAVWTGAYPFSVLVRGALSGSRVVFQTGHSLVATTY